MKIIIAVIAILGFTACSSSQKKSGQSSSKSAAASSSKSAQPAKSSDNAKTMTCESGKDKRTLAITQKDKGCELTYTKFGNAKVVSSSSHGTKHCEDSLQKITKKLEADKFKCKE